MILSGDSHPVVLKSVVKGVGRCSSRAFQHVIVDLPTNVHFNLIYLQASIAYFPVFLH